MSHLWARHAESAGLRLCRKEVCRQALPKARRAVNAQLSRGREQFVVLISFKWSGLLAEERSEIKESTAQLGCGLCLVMSRNACNPP